MIKTEFLRILFMVGEDVSGRGVQTSGKLGA